MSRIGNAPLHVPQGASVTVQGDSVLAKGPKGEVNTHIPADLSVKLNGNTVEVARKKEDRKVRALHGFLRAELANALQGVTAGWTKTLELSGVGYRATMAGANVVLTVGFSHPVTIVPPNGISFAITEGKVTVSGVNKQLVGQVAASIRAVKKPEPYKGKGIKYQGEHIRKKAGKAAKAIGGAPGAK